MAVGCRGGSRLTGHADLNFWLEIERQMAVPSPGQPTRLPLMAVRRPTPGLHRLAGVAGAFFGCALRPGPAVLAWLLRPGPSRRPRVCVGHASRGREAAAVPSPSFCALPRDLQGSLGPALVRLAAHPSRFSC